MSYTVTQGKGSQARIYEGLTADEAIARTEAILAGGHKEVAISGPAGAVDLEALKRSQAAGGSTRR